VPALLDVEAVDVIVLDVRILTTDKVNACMLEWIVAEGGSPILELGTSDGGASESTG